VPRAAFDAQRGATGALLVGSPEEVAEKICRHSESLGGISRVTFQMDNKSIYKGETSHVLHYRWSRKLCKH
jgi:alkanesulfonate monooxygenase SsuD/methylene tetrahydromethanopterin reductase-like flavin-dependent oxidoreductase (luciferase family)